MKYLNPFNESFSSDRIYNILSSSIEEIRNVLIDFEDTGTIKYNLSTLVSSFTPSTIGIDTYIKHAISVLGNTTYKSTKKDQIILKCEIKLSYKLNNQELNDYSKDKYEDLSVCLKRLESMGYGCSLDINHYLPQYGNAILRVNISIT